MRAMRAYRILILLCLWVSTTSTDCGKEKYEQKRTIIYVKGKFSNTSDTMYVGDTLTLTITIPDSSFKVSEYPPFDTTWYKIESFENNTGGYGLMRIDTNQQGGIDLINPYSESIIVKGDIGKNIFTKTSPYIHEMKNVLKMKGIFFFQSDYDIIPKINGIYGSMIIEWDVPYKNFELMRAWGEERYNAAIGSDYVDAYNYFLFEVIER